MNGSRLKISNPQRIARILRRICQASLQVMVRGVNDQSVAVKGRAAHLLMDSTTALRISNISERGIHHLASVSNVQVEFVMMSTKVVFLSHVLSREQGSIVVAMPTALVSIERRKNARFACTDDLSAYLDLSIWKPHRDDVAAPPYYQQYHKIAGFLAVADLSLGGLCVVTRFPAVNTVLRRGLIDDRAKLILPMQSPLNVGAEIRWFKRIKEHIRGGEGDPAYMRSYRFGVAFIAESEELQLSLRQFIQQLTQAGAI